MGIFILSREIRTGKTTELLNLCEGNLNVAGILMPDFNGKRFFYDIITQSAFQVQADDSDKENDLMEIGKFRFRKSSFFKAERCIVNTIPEGKVWMIIDEIGKLELNHQGLHAAIVKVLKAYQQQVFQHLLLVVRDTLLIQVIEHYQLQTPIVLKDLKSIHFGFKN